MMSEVKIKCDICGVEYNSYASLGKHIKRTHKIEGEDYYIKHMNNYIRPVCLCGNGVKFRNLAIGFSTHCSAKCSYHDPKVKSLREDTLINKYGSTTTFGSESVQEKIKSSILSKYGVTTIGASPEIQDKIKSTSLERYGVSNVLHLDDVKNKIRKTTIERYGCEHAMQNDDVKRKSKSTSLTRYGVEHPMQLESTREKLYESNKKKYGVLHASQSEVIKEKTRTTNEVNLGVAYPMQSHVVREKSRKSMLANHGVEYSAHSDLINKQKITTNIERYGCEYPTQNDNVKTKIQLTNMDKYGTANPMQNDDIKLKARNTNIIKYGVPYKINTEESRLIKKKLNHSRLVDKYTPLLTSYNCVYDSMDGTDFKLHCDKCGCDTKEQWQFVVKCRLERNITPCTNCVPKSLPYSFVEKEMTKYIKTLTNDVVENTRKVLYPQELDAYVPSMNLAFEFNGLLYHNELYKSTDYHINKTISCENKGIQLIHIYEDDWLYKQDIVKSRIRSLFGKSNIIYARKCEIRVVSSKDANVFLDVNHIQGKCVSKIRYGLYYLNELVAIMTFGKSRFETGKTELLRYCSILGHNVIGGASKLFSHFMKFNDIDEIITYADRSWSNGNMYKKLGFEFVSCTQPNYSYVVGNERYNRIHFQKHKLVNEGYDSSLTEHEIMLSREIYRIYDSGNLKFVYKRK